MYVIVFAVQDQGELLQVVERVNFNLVNSRPNTGVFFHFLKVGYGVVAHPNILGIYGLLGVLRVLVIVGVRRSIQARLVRTVRVTRWL